MTAADHVKVFILVLLGCLGLQAVMQWLFLP